MTFALLVLLAVAAYVYWRLHRSNMDVPPNVEQADEQWLIHINPREGEPLPRS